MRRVALSVGSLMLLAGLSVWAADDPNTPPNPPKPDQGNGAVIVRTDGPDGANVIVHTDRPGAGAITMPPMGRNFRWNQADMQKQAATAACRAAGIAVDPKPQAKLDDLSFGADRNFLLTVPVGGIESFATLGGAGHKIESVFKLTDEQLKALTGLREEYDGEKKKIEKEIADAEKALAEKVRQLRAKFEQRANDVLTGADKEAKEKIDALVQESYKKNYDLYNETMKQGGENDGGRFNILTTELRQKATQLVSETQTKILELMPAESRAKLEALFKEEQARREQISKWHGQGGRRQHDGNRQPGQGNPGGGAVQPPRPPDGKPAGEF